MRTLLKWLGISFLGLLVLVVVLFAGTRGDYTVHSLVTENAALPSVEINDVSLHLKVVEGPTDAPTIVVLHGGPGADFRSLLGLEPLSASHTIIFYDQRGAGLSERVPVSQLTLDHHLTELSAIADHFSSDRPIILIGHSWGAMLAAAYLDVHPRRVERVVLIEPGYLDLAGKDAWAAVSENYMSGFNYWREALLIGFRAQHVIATDDDAADDFLIGHMVGQFVNHPENPYHCGEGYTAPSWRFGAAASNRWANAPASEVNQIARITSFQGPVLFLAGACNTWIGPELQAEHAARFSDAQLVIIPNAGHDVIWDNADATLEAIRQFLAAR
ncbi:alpha/beta fold hydrolase [Pontivivens insulae]|uniref:Proline iminopeptidase n=1 Tax=Pontivivens insulae TaxID=1639689 RepID=A0A2R8AFY5_9RHOB|nr:alpha/beta hydrolase [Pontivivens insulae]RED10681.1 proline iminopeptidase [Pontivivens insulae]SPF31107.1 Proline iminopeptidase [Pontivivens insulae]